MVKLLLITFSVYSFQLHSHSPCHSTSLSTMLGCHQTDCSLNLKLFVAWDDCTTSNVQVDTWVKKKNIYKQTFCLLLSLVLNCDLTLKISSSSTTLEAEMAGSYIAQGISFSTKKEPDFLRLANLHNSIVVEPISSGDVVRYDTKPYHKHKYIVATT